MRGNAWKQALWQLLDSLAIGRLGRHVAVSATLLGLAATRSIDAAPGPQIPVNPVMLPEAEVRKLGGKYLLRRSRTRGLSVFFAGHRSHSSHSSHSSHASHSSSSHYSASHYSSSHSSAATPQPAIPAAPAPPPKPATIARDDFSAVSVSSTLWSRGVLATPPETYDERITETMDSGQLVVRPKSGVKGSHFGGFVSRSEFDLKSERISVELRRVASGAAVTIFAAARDTNNWIGFRIAGGILYCETRVDGRTSAKESTYDAERHRWLRLRPGTVAAVVVWETSADGKNWNPEFVTTPEIPISAVRVALSAGTTRAVSVPGSAAFDNFLVEKP